MNNIGKPKYGIINNGVFGVNIVSGIVTGIRYTEGKPLYEISFGKNKWWTDELCETPTDIFKALNLATYSFSFLVYHYLLLVKQCEN